MLSYFLSHVQLSRNEGSGDGFAVMFQRPREPGAVLGTWGSDSQAMLNLASLV